MRLDFEYPLLLILVPVCAAGVFFIWRSSRTYMPPIRRRASLVLRVAVVSLLVLALASPMVQLTADQLAVSILLDRSDSIGPNARVDQENWLAKALASKGVSDQVSVVSFGADATVESALSTDNRPPRLSPNAVDGRRTDIAAAIRTGMASLPPGSARRMVILSDGQENQEQADQAAALAAAAGVQIDTVALNSDSGPEVLVRQLDAPSLLHEGDRYTVTAQISSTVPTSARLHLLVDGQLVGTQQVDLQQGVNRFVLNEDPLQAGQHQVRLQVESEVDTLPENNSAGAVIVVSGPPKVLIIEGAPGEGQFLADSLRSSGLTVDVSQIANAPLDPNVLRDYASVVLANVSANVVAPGQLKSLQGYVRDFGGGLVVVGGDNSFGPGGYARTPLEDMLPVRMDLRGKSVSASVALMLVVDVSGSMGGGPGGASKMDLAKEAAIAAVELLGEYDQVGVLAFDDQNHWMIQPTFASDLAPIEEAISQMQPGGGTEIYPALKEAYGALSPLDARVKHMVLLTDGQAPRGDYPGLMQQMRDSNITLSTIGIGSDADTQLLQELAQLGNGRYYDGNDPFDLPRLLVKETQQVQRAAIVEQDTTPIAINPSPATDSIDFRSAPPLRGYVATTAKREASVLLASSQLDPILSEWQYGLGRVLAWTSDARNRWSSRWLEWPDFSKFWAQVVKRSTRPPEDPNRQISVSITGDQARIRLDAQTGAEATERRYLNFLPTTATLTDPRGNPQQVQMPQVAPGRYEALVPVQDDGVYMLNVSQTNADGSIANQSGGFVVPYSPEYRVLGTNETLLQDIARKTGGKMITDPEQAFVHDLPSMAAPRPLWPWLLAAAAILFVCDVGVRRVRITAPELRAGYYAVRRRLGYVDAPLPTRRDIAPDLARAPTITGVARIRRTDHHNGAHTGAPAGAAPRSSRLLAAKQRAARR
ncbi:MAG: VWA domain-containing protein [Chloroflexi bacterium]|nr:VWA domain-containing protein [Chloroflexota bacterium]